MRSRFFVLLAAAGCVISGQFAASAATTPRPTPVHALAAYERATTVHLDWTNPTGLDRVVVRYARGAQAPATPTTGRAVHLARPTAQWADLAHLVPGARYSVSVWTKQAHRFSKRITTSFFTKAKPAPLATIRGVVTDAAGHPLAGAEVDGFDLVEYHPTGTVRTGPTGTFRLHVPAGRYEVDAGGAGATGGNSDATGYTPDSVTVRAASGATRDVHLSLSPGSAVHGTVTDENGNPLSGVEVTWQPPMPYLQQDNVGVSLSFVGLELGSVRTGVHGRYALTGLPLDALVPCFTATHATGGDHDRLGYQARCATSATMPPAGGSTTVPTTELAPATGSLLTGTVRDALGRIVRYPDVSLDRVHGFDSEFADTDAHGNYRVAGLTAGKWRLCADAEVLPTRFASAPSCRIVTVRKNAHTVADAHLVHGGALSGRLVDPSGHAVSNVEVDAEQVQDGPTSGMSGGGVAVTDGHGDYTVGSLPPGTYQLCYRTPGNRTPDNPTGLRPECPARKFTVTVDRDRIGADAALGTGGAVSGTVTDVSGHPVRNAYVAIERLGPPFDGGGGKTNRDGAFDVAGLTPGRYRVCAYPSLSFGERQVCLGHSVDVTAGHTVTGVRLQFGAQTAIRVTVTDSSGHRLAATNVALLHSCPSGDCAVHPVFGQQPVSVRQTTMTATDGRADFSNVGAGKYAICAFAYYATPAVDPSPTGYADKCTGHGTFTVTTTAGTTTQVSVTLDQGGTVTGRVTDANGHGLRHVAIQLTGSPTDDIGPSESGFESSIPMPDPFQDLFTDGHGRYSIHSVQPGDQPLCGRKNGYAHGCLSAPVSITGGAVTTAPRLVLSATAAAFAPQQVSARPAAHVLRFIILNGRIVAVRH